MRQRLAMHVSRHGHGDLGTLRQRIETGQVTLLLGRACRLAGVPEAMPDFQAGHARGKPP
jgi:hypothetical protein